ncbi:3-oxoacyl-[acyl-carrier protein] reductase [Actinoplanes lutulentus]|uniref:3-oxoacyl-[acyl-carrier protein] reductase n=1 Tax=Actinoplanes lutulentus TaxID=1287878 RepID=A0A327YYC7_9ACTN|nr:SDR family oxidoreductase [Actinoplanes lutulentus]MBB2943031.1 3-oxoacyl-[acyl-carrier protein] reductase [Actinoplanes lutulentus]RAK26702.1 3-oxoacyl-[acyl-carrier protein] reductase [Actinoplanes lutulentus]
MPILGSALVTGASRGLGAHIARRLAADGWPVAINYRSDAAGAERIASEILAAGGQAAALRADITDEAGVRDLVAEASDRLGPVQAVVANATGPQPSAPAELVSWRDHLDQLEFFVKSPTLLLAAALPGMRSLGTGRFVHIGSDSFERAIPGASAYNAAKGAQIGLARTWARELGVHGVTVNVVAPGWIPVERHGPLSPDDTREYVADVPLGRIGTPQDVADVVAFVCSDAARFVTGERITVNGGHTID